MVRPGSLLAAYRPSLHGLSASDRTIAKAASRAIAAAPAICTVRRVQARERAPSVPLRREYERVDHRLGDAIPILPVAVVASSTGSIVDLDRQRSRGVGVVQQIQADSR
jgi:hypothetical protein